MTGSTWTWTGSFWTLTAGAGNGSNRPSAGDTVINTTGTVATSLDTAFVANTIYAGGVGGITAALLTYGDSGIATLSPTTDRLTVISEAVPGQSAAESAQIAVSGLFINNGTILANGPSGSRFTIAVSPLVTNAATYAGQFGNFGLIDVLPGNSLIVSGGTFGSFGTFAVDGGSATINAALAPTGFNSFDISSGGSLELAQTDTLSSQVITFRGNGSLKLDQPSTFSSSIIDGFVQGDTLDLGAVTIAAISYDGYGDLYATDAGGQVVFATTADYGALAGASAGGSFALSATGGNAGYITVNPT